MKINSPTRYTRGRIMLPCAIMLLTSFLPLKVQATTYTVNSLADAGTGTGTAGDLRYCITQANASAATPHVINFSVAGTITLGSNLPVFTRPISVMGNTGTGYTVAAPVIQINANSVGWGFLFNNAGAANSVLRGLVINRAQATAANIEINNVSNITIQDCFIGVNLAGTAATATNPYFGILLITSSNNQILNNVISGHTTHGILVNVNSLNNVIKGNKIGTNALGTAAIPNAFQGIEINNTSTGTIVGGNAAGERNLISGNSKTAITIVGGSTGTQVIGNYIGVNAAGTGALGNGEHGVYSNASGAVTITNNVISGSTYYGILLTSANSHVIKGNKIGTNAAGTAAIANLNAGVSIVSGNFVVIGGTAAGEGNVVSGNGDAGLRFESSTDATVQGNFIGTNYNGTAVIGNAMGIYATTNSNNHLIGGNTTAARNIISGNATEGLMYNNACNDLTLQGNYIGTDAAGSGAGSTFGNGFIGVYITNNCLRTNIGGTTAAQMNVISGNGRLWTSVSGGNGTGIQIESGSTNANIRGNYIGIAADGTTAMPNTENGIVATNGCDNLTIGGNTAATRNVISSNVHQAIVINFTNAVTIIGNYIGVDATGTLARGNGQSGVILIFSSNCFIGRANAGEGNILSNNSEEGIHIVGGVNNTIYNNNIGVAANGTTAMGNKNGGIFIQGVGGGTNGSLTIVGGTGALQPNIIAYSTNTGVNPDLGNGFGIGVAHNDQGIQNRFIANKIFCNAGLGIDLDFAGAFGGGANGVGNGGKPAPTITAVSTTVTSGTGIAGETIHVYSNVTCTTCQGEIYLGSTTVTAGGTWSLTHASVTTPANNSATATSTALGTSQFSCNTALPVTWLSFTAELRGEDVQLNWITGNEINNDRFEIERSSDGTHFYTIGFVIGKVNYSGITNYIYTDLNSLTGISYYRIRQVDIDGQYEYSVVKTIQRQSISGTVLYPNPTEGLVYLTPDAGSESYEVSILNVLGVEIISETILNADQATQSFDLSAYPNGVYILTIKYAQEIKSYQLIKR